MHSSKQQEENAMQYVTVVDVSKRDKSFDNSIEEKGRIRHIRFKNIQLSGIILK